MVILSGGVTSLIPIAKPLTGRTITSHTPLFNHHFGAKIKFFESVYLPFVRLIIFIPVDCSPNSENINLLT